jgi:hypothetical protein
MPEKTDTPSDNAQDESLDYLVQATKRVKEKIKKREEEEEEQRRKEMDDQKKDGRCNLIPFPKVAAKPFRSELTIESTTLFVVNSFKGHWYTCKREIEDENGQKVTQQITVGRLNKRHTPRGVLKQVHQEVFYKLLKMWGDDPQNEYRLNRLRKEALRDQKEAERKNIKRNREEILGSFTTTPYALVKALRSSDSQKDYDRVHALLDDLATIPIVIESLGKETRSRRYFKLLAYVDWNEVNVDHKTRRPKPGGESSVTIYFSPLVTEGFLKKRVKQLLMTPYLELGARSDLARLLYSALDYELASKNEYHCRLTKLAERFGMAEHQYRSFRRRPFEQAISRLNGCPILGEHYTLHLCLRPDANDLDDVLVATKRRISSSEPSPEA